jgi:hypothetical protein
VQEMGLCKAEALESGCGHAHAAMRVEDDVQALRGGHARRFHTKSECLTSVT